jgi:hypothetical protein
VNQLDLEVLQEQQLHHHQQQNPKQLVSLIDGQSWLVLNKLFKQ